MSNYVPAAPPAAVFTKIPSDNLPVPGQLPQSNTQYMSYSGADIVAQIVLPNSTTLTIGELQTLSYSMHRDNSPVRTLGHVNPLGFVRGARTIAGSMIFTVFNSYAFYRLQDYQNYVNQGLFPIADMLPPFDIVITYANEYGMNSKMKILGVTILDEGGTMSIDDMITESTFTYIARGIQPMIPYNPRSNLSASTALPPVTIGFTNG